MGFRFRKSVKIGIFRVNFSKHGIGWSVGVPGYRKTYKANGGTRTTYSIPGTGISYSQDSSKKNNNIKINNSINNTSQPVQIDNSTKIETVINDSSQNEFVEKLNEVTSFNKKRKIILIIASIFGVGSLGNIGGEDTALYILMFLACLGLIIYFFKKKSMDLKIDMDDEFNVAYNNLNDSMDVLNSIDRVWEINSYNTNTNITTIGRNIATYGKGKIDHLNTNNEFFYINSKGSKIYFLPNMILVYQNKKWHGVEYKDIEIDYENTSFAETEYVPKDTALLLKKYEHQNKDGSPDKRFKDNKIIYYYAYGIVGIESNNGLKLYILVSNREKGIEFKDYIKNYMAAIVSKTE